MCSPKSKRWIQSFPTLSKFLDSKHFLKLFPQTSNDPTPPSQTWLLFSLSVIEYIVWFNYICIIYLLIFWTIFWTVFERAYNRTLTSVCTCTGNQINYLLISEGQLLGHKDGGADEDISSCTNKASHAFDTLRPIWNFTALSKQTKLCIFSTNVKADLLYGSETWRLTKPPTNSRTSSTNVSAILYTSDSQKRSQTPACGRKQSSFLLAKKYTRGNGDRPHPPQELWKYHQIGTRPNSEREELAGQDKCGDAEKLRWRQMDGRGPNWRESPKTESTGKPLLRPCAPLRSLRNKNYGHWVTEMYLFIYVFGGGVKCELT